MKKNLLISIIVGLSLFSMTYAQYYYFSDSSSNGYQQGCNETIDVRFDTEAEVAGAGIFHLVLDDTRIDYNVNPSNVLIGSTLSFPNWVVGFPKRKIGSSNTILEAERYNESNVTATVRGDLSYGRVNFVPKYSGNVYNVEFGMDYISGFSTVETTLSYQGVEIIDPLDQVSRLTETILIEQEPCSDDTANPSISDNLYNNGDTKVVNNGLDIDFRETTSQGIVPYVFDSVGLWVANPGGVNNQYGVDSGTVSVTVAGNGYSIILNQFVDFIWTATNKTRQYKDRDYNIVASSGQLFNFGIEKVITISSFVQDRLGHTISQNISFNHPNDAWVSNIYPVNNQKFVILDEAVKFKISDDWAGVDSGSILVTLSGMDNDFYGVYSGSSLMLSGVSGSANFPDYNVIVNHVDFPTSGTIRASVYGTDLEGNGGTLAIWSFTTRPDCEELGCCDIKLQTGDVMTQFYYINTNLYISGGNNAYITGFLDTIGYINCNTRDEGLSIYKGHGDNNTGVFVGFLDSNVLNFNGDNVRAVLSGNTLILTKISIPGGGGGGGTVVPKDDCPDGDLSISYYDGSCGDHSSPDMCGVNASDYSSELKGAYLYSYMYGITTMCPIEEADLDGYLYRNHFAKMASEFAVNVLGKEPDIGKAGCNDFDDIEGDTEELRGFIKIACELSLMGMHADGVTPKESFFSTDYVTRAQFGTVFSRMLFGEEYNIDDESAIYEEKGYWYNDHLNALKEYGIMTMIHDDWPDKLELRGWVMLMMQRADNYGLFVGVLPVLNGITALFD